MVIMYSQQPATSGVLKKYPATLSNCGKLLKRLVPKKLRNRFPAQRRKLWYGKNLVDDITSVIEMDKHAAKLVILEILKTSAVQRLNVSGWIYNLLKI